MHARFSISIILFACLLGCGDDGGDPVAHAAPADAAAPDGAAMAQSLRDTGLYADITQGVLAPGVRAYRPAFELWSDSAAKERYILLPEGAVIDTSDMDFWRYPEGTKLWKHFTRDGVRIETRLLEKTGPESWLMMAYLWTADGRDAVAVPDGVDNALGTEHDVPETDECEKCHLRMPDAVIGVSAILLDHDLGHDLGGVTLAALVEQGRLSNQPEAPPDAAGRYFPLPGDDTAKAALGYLHANCGNCHNSRSSVMDKVLIDLHLGTAGLASVEETTIYRTGVGVLPDLEHGAGITALIVPGSPEASAVHLRMTSREEDLGMPPLGSELIDDTGVAAVAAWIRILAPR